MVSRWYLNLGLSWHRNRNGFTVFYFTFSSETFLVSIAWVSQETILDAVQKLISDLKPTKGLNRAQFVVSFSRPPPPHSCWHVRQNTAWPPFVFASRWVKFSPLCALIYTEIRASWLIRAGKVLLSVAFMSILLRKTRWIQAMMWSWLNFKQEVRITNRFDYNEDIVPEVPRSSLWRIVFIYGKIWILVRTTR